MPVYEDTQVAPKSYSLELEGNQPGVLSPAGNHCMAHETWDHAFERV